MVNLHVTARLFGVHTLAIWFHYGSKTKAAPLEVPLFTFDRFFDAAESVLHLAFDLIQDALAVQILVTCLVSSTVFDLPGIFSCWTLQPMFAHDGPPGNMPIIGE
jgi:hypothetical protein